MKGCGKHVMDVIQKEAQSGIRTGLPSLGFAFNPFAYLEASNDPYLPDYLIGHEMFAVAWESSPAALFAPAGGGKSAMRIYTLRTCWLSSSQRRKFPISYDIPIFAHPRDLTTFDAHRTALAAAAATDLLLACAYRPELYLGLNPARRVFLISLLRQALPTDLTWSLSILAETASPRRLSEHLDRTYALPEPPSANQVGEFCLLLQTDLERSGADDVPSALLFDFLVEFIYRDLGFESIFILVDGVDGTSSLASNAAAQYQVIAPLCEQALSWAKEHLYLKAFLPIELEPVLASQAEAFYRGALRAAITWDVPHLAEILRRRVYVASGGKLGSLDALSSPALRDVETLIAQRARPLPREVIVLAGKVMENYLAHSGGYLEPEHIETAEKEYHKSTVFAEPHNFSS